MTNTDEKPTGADLGIVHVEDDVRSASDASLGRVAQIMAAKGQPIRIRVPLALWDGSNYVAWRSQIWKLEAKDHDGALMIQQTLEQFFETLMLVGLERTMELLTTEVEKYRKPPQQQEPVADVATRTE